MPNKFSSMLDSIADSLESKGFIKEALDIDKISDILDVGYKSLEKQLEEAYERHAPQSQINHLETELAKRVSEEDLVGGDLTAASEGYAIDEDLRDLYQQYLNAGNTVGTGNPYSRQELIEIMRGAIKGGLIGQRPVEGLTDAQILEAAKDAYEHRLNLNQRRRILDRKNRTPGEALRELSQIKKRIVPNR
jgi:hypothetical protein